MKEDKEWLDKCSRIQTTFAVSILDQFVAMYNEDQTGWFNYEMLSFGLKICFQNLVVKK